LDYETCFILDEVQPTTEYKQSKYLATVVQFLQVAVKSHE
jgi:hypothetical protein